MAKQSRQGFWARIDGLADSIAGKVESLCSALLGRGPGGPPAPWEPEACALLAKLAKADGPVNRPEIACCRRLFRSGLFRAPEQALQNVFRRAKDDGADPLQVARQLALKASETALRERLYLELFELAGADGACTPAELALLERLPAALNINPAAFAAECRRRGLAGAGGQQQNPGQPQGPSLETCYKILGVPESATDQELKAAYRKRARKLHPDTLKAQGLSPDLVKQATDKMTKVNEAWDILRKERDIK